MAEGIARIARRDIRLAVAILVDHRRRGVAHRIHRVPPPGVDDAVVVLVGGGADRHVAGHLHSEAAVQPFDREGWRDVVVQAGREPCHRSRELVGLHIEVQPGIGERRLVRAHVDAIVGVAVAIERQQQPGAVGRIRQRRRGVTHAIEIAPQAEFCRGRCHARQCEQRNVRSARGRPEFDTPHRKRDALAGQVFEFAVSVGLAGARGGAEIHALDFRMQDPRQFRGRRLPVPTPAPATHEPTNGHDCRHLDFPVHFRSSPDLGAHLISVFLPRAGIC